MGKNYKILRNKPILSSKAIISNEMVKISKRKKSHFRLILKIILQNSSFKKKMGIQVSMSSINTQTFLNMPNGSIIGYFGIDCTQVINIQVMYIIMSCDSCKCFKLLS